MKINNCKLCEPVENQKLSGEKGCRHMPNVNNAAATAAFLSSQHYIRDFLAFHLLTTKGYYQPAGPLISSHLLPPQSIPQPLESDQTQSSQSTTSTTADNVDPDVMITGGDLTPRPYHRGYPPPHPHPDYSRPHPHQMHQYNPYPPYAYFGAPSPSPQPPPMNHFQEVIPYYPKYFSNPSYPRRYYYPLDYRSSQPVPQNPQSQILPSTPTPQHPMEHYPSPPFYSAYGPPPNAGGQCFSQTQPRSLQPQFLESPHYSSPSYHTCPKNAHTGTGPTNKGPVSAETKAPASAIVTSSAANNICKIENILAPNVMTIKPENKMSDVAKPLELYSHSHHVAKVGLEQPEMTLSPARGSTGLQLPASVQQESATQLTESKLSNSRLHQSTFMTSIDTTTTPLDITQLKQEFQVKKELNLDGDTNNSYNSMKPIENVKVERQQSSSVASTSSSTQVINSENNSTHESGDDECIDYTMRKNESDDVIELSDNSCMDPPANNSLARRKLLSAPVNIPKKSPPNSYKSLIKQSTISPLGKSKKATLKRRNILKPKTTTVLKKKIRMAVTTKKRFLLKKKRKSLTKVVNDEKSISNEKSHEIEESSSSCVSEKNVEFCEDKSIDDTSDYSGKSNIDETIDRVAKGYFSESEILSTLSKYRKKKVKKQLKEKKITKAKANQSKVKGKTNKNQENDEKKKSKNDAVDNEMMKLGSKSKKPKKDDKKSSSDEKPNKKVKKTPTKKQLKPTPVVVIEEAAIPTPPPTVVESDEDDAKLTSIERDEETSTTVISSSLNTSKSILDETDVANNNNECFENNNQMSEATSETDTTKSVIPFMKQEPLTLYKTPGYGWTTLHKTTKRGKGKGAKFTNRKKQKVTLLNDIVIPRCTSIPRWSNGWTWVGEPFQAYVFLDSDNPPVPRTCYEAMRHEECGDVIRPHDCVLLRAGGKKNELPYVAKVAQLWENPEDGEMMMSLFWYYRPEHTEQGRQSLDAADEVFASRHKDHNSVACIEDKCYVLTYNEYCRYRRNCKMLDENLEEQPSSLVPRLGMYHERRLVPPNTSPELVMFCRRVYDFRAKRLVEDKNKKR